MIDRRRFPRFFVPVLCALILLLILSALFFLLRPSPPQTLYPCRPVGEEDLLVSLDLSSDIREEGDRCIAVHLPVTHLEEADAALTEAAERWLASFEEQSSGLNSTGSAELLVLPEITRLNPDIVSIRLSCEMSFGERAETDAYTLTVDLAQGKVLSLSDFFQKGSGYLKLLSDKAFRRLKAWQEELGISDEEARALTLAKEENFRLFSLDSDSLTLYFPVSGREEAVPVRLLLRDLTDVSLFDLSSPAPDESSPERASAEASKQLPESSGETPPDGAKQVALTFDDGPHPEYTAQILDALEEYGAKATFFVTGCRVPYYPQLVRRMAEGGHAVGNHTYSHRQLGNLTPDELSKELSLASSAIMDAGLARPVLMRPPFESLGSKVKTIDSMTVILSTLQMSGDQTLTEEETAAALLEEVTPGCVIALNELSEKAPGVTRILLRELSAQGYDFVTADVLYNVNEES